MSANPRLSSPLGISSAELKPTISSGLANGHFPLPTSGTPTITAAAFTATPESNSISDLQLLISKIQEDMRMVDVELNNYGTRATNQTEEASKKKKKFEEASKTLRKEIEAASKMVNILANSPIPKDDRHGDVQEDINEVKKNVVRLRLQILSELKPLLITYRTHPHRNHHTHESTHERRKSKNLDKIVPNLCKNETLARSSEFKEFKELYDGLGDRQKLCLLCFSVFPEKEIIKKRFMFYWWTGEGFLAPAKGTEQTTEEWANEIFSELMAKCFIEPFSEKRTLAGWVNKCQVHPFVRAAIIKLARRAKFFDFDAEGKPTGKFSSSFRACLLAEELLNGETLTERKGMDNVHMLFNVDENYIDFEKPELFSLMKNINLLCLGRWQTSQTHHIEVEDTKFLEEGLKHMKHLKFLSLQGISLIKVLPSSISNLTDLKILDVRACPNLEKIPEQIGFLKSLTHLDMSECYLLVKMPKQISTLLQLEVIKGFIVGTIEGNDQEDSCTLGHLEVLTKLRKLSIFTGKKSFPSHSELLDLNRLKKLLILRIEWGKDLLANSESNTEEKAAVEPSKQKNSGGAETQNPANGDNMRESNNANNDADSRTIPSTTNCFGLRGTLKTYTAARPELPSQLEKLDLQCFPHLDAPTWLMDEKLERLKTLYIRGGMLRDLGQFGFQEQKREWAVEILRLKFLNNLEMDWRELMKLFPELKYLEKARCPKLTFFPCDEQGVWMKRPAH